MSDFYDLNKKLAGLDKVQLNESCEAEQLDELGKSTLGSYIKKAAGDVDDTGYAQAHDIHRLKAQPSHAQSVRDMHQSRLNKRHKGIERATDRLVKEKNELLSFSVNSEAAYNEGYRVIPPIDRDAFGDREHKGLEGPINANGRPLYYDKREGKYYDPRTDLFLSHEEAEEALRECGLYEISDELANRAGDARHAAVKSADRKNRDEMMSKFDKFSKNQRLQHSRDIRQQKAGIKGVDPRTAEYQNAKPGQYFGDSVEPCDQQLDELSPATLGSYVKKASHERGYHGAEAGRSGANRDRAAERQHTLKGEKRQQGINTAVSKMAGGPVDESPQIGMFEKDAPRALSPHERALLKDKLQRLQSQVGEKPELAASIARIKKLLSGKMMSESIVVGDIVMFETTPGFTSKARVVAVTEGQFKVRTASGTEYLINEAEAKKAKKDYDKDGKIESPKDEVIGSRLRAAKKAGKLEEEEKADKDYDGDGKIESPKDEVIGSRRRAAGLDEEKPSAGLSKEKKSAVAKKAHAGKDIGKKGKGFDAVAKNAGGGEKGKKIAAAAMWKNIKREGQGEELDELSPKKLKSYAKKSNKDAMSIAGDALQAHDMKDYGREEKARTKLGNRLAGQQRAQSRLAGPRVVEEDQAMYALDEYLDDLESSIANAVQEAENLYKIARRSHPSIANQIKAYTLPWLMAWINDSRQPGSIKSLRANLHGEEEMDETTNVTDFNPKSQGGTRKELLSKLAKSKDPKHAEAARRAGASQGELKRAMSGEEELDEKAVSKKQQKFMGMVHAAQKGEKPASKEVAKVAKSMKKKDAEDFASTKHKGLPEKKKEKKDDNKGKEKKVKETASAGSTSSGSVAPSDSGSSKGGMQYGKGVYEGVMESMDKRYNQLLNEGLKVTTHQNEDGSSSGGITIVADGPEAEELSRLLNLSGLDQDSCDKCGGEMVDENQPDWPTNPETSNDPFQYSGGLNKPKSTGQTTIPVIAGQTKRMGTMEESVELERTLFNLYHIMGKGE